MRKRILTACLVVAIALSVVSERAAAQFTGEGAFSSILDYLRKATVNIVPAITNTYDLGSSTKMWRTGYFGTSISTPSVVTSGATERIVGATYGEYIDFLTKGDGYITLQGSGGADNTNISLNLDGVKPVFSTTDTEIGFNNDIAMGGGTTSRFAFQGGEYLGQTQDGFVDLVGVLLANDAGNTKKYKYAVADISYLSATEPRVTGWGNAQLSVGLAGVDEIGGTEGYVSFNAAADYLIFAMCVPSTFVDKGAAGDLVLQFDMLETGAAECNYDVRVFEYGNTTPIITDTILIADGAARTWNGLVTLSSGIGAVAAIDADDILIVELTATADADTANVYGARLKYRVGLEATQ